MLWIVFGDLIYFLVVCRNLRLVVCRVGVVFCSYFGKLFLVILLFVIVLVVFCLILGNREIKFIDVRFWLGNDI